jgi:hypothetical protein
MSPDEYEEKLRKKGSGSLGLVVYAGLMLMFTLLGEALWWLFWSGVFK